MKNAVYLAVSVAALILLAAIARGVWIGWQLDLFAHPTDEELIISLTEHRDDFERLAEMLQEDGISMVSTTIYIPDGELNEARWNEYRELIDRLEIIAVSRRIGHEDPSIWFDMSMIITLRPFDGNSYKGIVFKPRQSDSMFDSLDRAPHSLEPGVDAYRNIEEDWFIFLNYNP